MTACEICEGIKNHSLKILYQDEKIIAFLEDNPASVGHIIVAPITHFAIIEQVPDDLLAYCAIMANKLSTILFESLNIQGTNLIIQNGLPAGQKYNHAYLNILPRTETDGLEIMWNPKQISEQDMAQIELGLKDNLSKPPSNSPVTSSSKENPKPAPVPTEPQSPKASAEKAETPTTKLAPATSSYEKDSSDEYDNYLIRQLRRIP